MRYLLTTLSIVFFAASCTKVEKIEKVGLTPSSMVVNLRAVEGDAFDFAVSKSLNVLDNASIKPLKTAKIKLYEEGVLVETIVFNNISLSYLGTTVAKTKKKYKIECTATGFGTSVSEFFVPEKPVNGAASLKIIKDKGNKGGGVFYDSFNFEEGTISFVLKDKAEEENGYIITLKEKWTQSGGGGGGPIDYFGFSSWQSPTPGVVSFSSNLFSAGSTQEFYVSDDLFQGKDLVIDLKTANSYNQFYNGRDSLKSYEIEIFSLSDGYYKHCLNRKQYENGKGDFFKEPVYIYSNVSNGFGACGGVSATGFSIPFKL